MEFNKYNEEWSDIIRPEILKRDNYKCMECGVQHKRYILRSKEGQWKYIEKDEYEEYNKLKERVYKVHLQVAHLDNIKENNNPDNLKTLCLWCHLKYDKDYKRLLRIAKKKSSTISSLLNSSQDALLTPHKKK